MMTKEEVMEMLEDGGNEMLLEVIAKLCETLKDQSQSLAGVAKEICDRPAPVAAAGAAPAAVSIPAAPRTWNIEVTERDPEGRIKRISCQAYGK